MNEILENTIDELQLDRSNWELIKFGDVAIQQKQSVDREYTELTKYVKGEHMESEDLHLRKWGELTDEYLGPAFIRRFEENDILYGSRRTYLRKVVIAPFPGITSNTTFVVKANEKKIDKRLLPFIMMSEGFTENSIKNSKGSVNPYINWKDISKYEFLLPPKDLQAQLAELLWRMDEVIEKNNKLLKNSLDLKKSFFNEALYKKSESLNSFFGTYKSKFPVVKLGKLLKIIQYGISQSLSEEKKGTPILRMNNLQGGKLDVSDLKYYISDNEELKNFMLDKGDILFNRTNSFDLVGKVSIFREEEDYSFASYLIRLKVNNKELDSEYLNFFLNSAIGLSKIRKYRTPGVSQSNINAQSLRKIILPHPPLEFQQILMQKIRSFEIAEDSLYGALNSAKSLQKSIINQIF